MTPSLPALPPPTVPGLPLLGSALSIARDPMRYLLDCHGKYGPVFTVRAAHRKMVVLAGEGANAFVHDEGKAYFSNEKVWAPTLAEMGAPNSFVGLDGDLHRALRKQMADQFSRPAAEKHLQNLVALTHQAFAEETVGESIPFVRFGQRLVSRQIGSSLVGRIPSPDEHEAIYRYTTDVVVTLMLERLPRWLLWMKGPRYWRDRRAALDFGERIVTEHLAREDREENFIDAVVAASSAHPGLFGESELRANGMLPFFAGVDTVGQTIGFLIYEVLRSPELTARIRKEADELFAAGAIDPKALRKAPDIQGAVLESLRRYPVAFAMPRYAAEDFEFAGHSIAKGRSLLVFTTACHFMPEYFPDPERFDIDRYRPPRDEHRRPNVFAPFGRGPHQCLGAGFATIQLTAMLATMMHACDLELPDPDEPIETILRPSLSLGEKFKVRFNGWRNRPPLGAGL